jgi:UDPglucose--hexose-1-phosphate uridylyltransferase
MIYKDIKKIVLYALHHQLLEESDYSYAVNKICTVLGLDTFVDEEVTGYQVEEPSTLLSPLLDYAVKEGLIEVDTVLNRDLFEAKIMDILIPRPSEVNKQFYELYKVEKKQATQYYYNLSKKSNYIKTSRTDKNIIWTTKTEYGVLDMTINLSKPEKDPRDIINAKHSDHSYPKCLLCKEHVGFSGRPGRVNHRIIPVSLNNEEFYFQYSPYVYYNEHSIVLMKEHIPMNVSVKTFKRLFDFVDLFPHYFLGSNAGLPIVGGSILAHEHYQGGSYHFPIEDAEVIEEYQVNDLEIQVLKWPLSVIRLRSKDKERVINGATKLFELWEQYSDESVGIVSYTDQPHNAITPIARVKDGVYELDMTLRNNRTSIDYPLGIFHPHQENHNIKKENIGLIEVMGLAVLPARLKEELPVVKQALLEGSELQKEYEIHLDWLTELKEKYKGQDIDTFINNEVGYKFMKCLEDAGVFKQTETGLHAFQTFVKELINVLR